MKRALDEKGLITNNLQRDESSFLISVFLILPSTFKRLQKKAKTRKQFDLILLDV